MKIAGQNTGRLLFVFLALGAAACLEFTAWMLGGAAVIFRGPPPAPDPEIKSHILKVPDAKPQTITDERGSCLAKESTGYFIYINLDEKRLFLYLNGEQVRNYPCAGGKAESPSPEGAWQITEKSTWGKGFGGVWMGLDVPWGKYGIHGTKMPWLVGRSHVSKGCIRLISENARELFGLIPYKTPVVIEYKNAPFRQLKSGDVGSDVLEIQKNLTRLGHYTGAFDGRFGKGLFRAVTQFQEENALPVTGIIDKHTHNLINERLKSAPETKDISNHGCDEDKDRTA